MAQNKLTTARLRKLPPGKHGDGGGLWVKIGEDGGLTWSYRFRLNGRRREIGIPGGSAVSLPDARKERDKLAALVARGEDPLLVRRAAQEELQHTFGAMAADALEARRASLKNERAVEGWIQPLKNHVLPKLGARPVTEISATAIRDALKPIWRAKPEVARKALMRIGVVLKHAAAAGIDVDAFAADRAKILLGQQMHRPKKTESMPVADIPGFYASLGESPTDLALALIVLTGLRSAPVRLLRVEHVGLPAVDGAPQRNTLLIPGSSMKGLKKYEDELAFRVPLSDEADRVVSRAQELFARDGWIFVEPGRRQPISYNSLPMKMRRSGLPYRPHGFRASLNDWMRGRGVPREFREMILQHRKLSAVSSHYERDDLLEQRREILDDWADHVVSEKYKRALAG